MVSPAAELQFSPSSRSSAGRRNFVIQPWQHTNYDFAADETDSSFLSGFPIDNQLYVFEDHGIVL